MVLTFPDCWDGEHLDSEDHRVPRRVLRDGCVSRRPTRCTSRSSPSSITFPISGRATTSRLASGNVYSAHGDFFNAWDPDGLEREVRQLHPPAGVVCDLASNRQEEPLFQPADSGARLPDDADRADHAAWSRCRAASSR